MILVCTFFLKDGVHNPDVNIYINLSVIRTIKYIFCLTLIDKLINKYCITHRTGHTKMSLNQVILCVLNLLN